MTMRKSRSPSDEEIREQLEGLSTIECIALKFWWGWTPQPRQSKWIIPAEYNQRVSFMNKEEREWFKQH